MNLALTFFEPEVIFHNAGMWMFLSIGAIALFVVFIPLVSWIESRRKEREAFYKADTLRRLAEAPPDGAKLALAMMHEEGRLKRIKTMEGLKIGGLVNVGIGIGLIIFLRAMIGGGNGSPYLCGLIPAAIGAAMLAYVFFLAAPIE